MLAWLETMAVFGRLTLPLFEEVAAVIDEPVAVEAVVADAPIAPV